MRLRLLNDVIGLGLRGGKLLVPILICLVQGRLLVLPGVLDFGESLFDRVVGRLHILYRNIDQRQSDVLLFKFVHHYVFDVLLDVGLARGQRGIHSVSADGPADRALDQVLEDQLRLLGRVHVLKRIGHLIRDIKVDVHEIHVRSDHGGFFFHVRVVPFAAFSVSDLEAADRSVDLGHLLDERYFELEALVVIDGGLPQRRHHSALRLRKRVKGSCHDPDHKQNRQNRNHHTCDLCDRGLRPALFRVTLPSAVRLPGCRGIVLVRFFVQILFYNFVL